ncbi:hypothetical protein [Kineothrix sp. MB12-C1]|uniref:hypothetical protein n=1 Tax=Kineothrix sp. MB12-C1 TaxID=3070215 RepID=UPI0027D2ABD6|nr:hypothetical protein [Kineothrix sp. MB12-C1]WMC93903.1 hypothetical protein RBB56_06470 [Kineothrix sp. MB12-C1]
MDLIFLFWSISVGIICGAGLPQIAVLMSLFVTAAVICLEKIPLVRPPMILVIHAARGTDADEIVKTVNTYCKYSKIKTRTLLERNLNLVIEVRTDKGNNLLQAIDSLDGINSVSLLEHNGEVTYQ